MQGVLTSQLFGKCQELCSADAQPVISSLADAVTKVLKGNVAVDITSEARLKELLQWQVEGDEGKTVEVLNKLPKHHFQLCFLRIRREAVQEYPSR